MVEEKKDVKTEQADAQSNSSEDTNKQDATVSEDVKTEVSDADNQYRQQYENARKAMQDEREARQEATQKASDLEERLAKLEASNAVNPLEVTSDNEGDYDPIQAKVDILTLMNKDSFVKENLDLIEAKMTDNKGMDVTEAVKELKSDFFDRIQQDTSVAEVNNINQEKPTATTPEKETPKVSDNMLEDALAGKLDIDPAQIESIRRTLGR